MLMALSALAALLWLLLPSIRQASWQDIIGFLPVPVLIYGLLSGIRKKQVTESRPAAKRGRKPAAKKKEGQSLTRKAPTGKAKAQPAVNKKSKAAGS
ncbi:hypothetical protein [Ectobacillus ponti]|uniref:Uncharacterized protein n=1 Tax=Ectobacillus ponti TaxID=2961894 RepID=A0AA42BR03_9BACI|nr:hypothetical protein [Ectobacillus ponti]MCP8968994.1 hypothetical protein [Ectobacillus ponti]